MQGRRGTQAYVTLGVGIEEYGEFCDEKKKKKKKKELGGGTPAIKKKKKNTKKEKIQKDDVTTIYTYQKQQ
eukprot:NODE_24777_length_611_cov_3.404959.p3 GENE.NODE_24777_length_611_cov_3.404959~~NODE_24777_length_611_cov_3.404959.p3  ORF type:complete len:71 (+),score=31.45 NODE_24777_length_611_cov_3.404959:338-550(+)